MKYEFVIDYLGLPALITVYDIYNVEAQPRSAQIEVDLAMMNMGTQYFPTIKSFAISLAELLLCQDMDELEAQSDDWEEPREDGVIY